MSTGALRGLLTAALNDPFFADIRSATGSITHEVTGPPAIRPFVVGALAADDAAPGVPVLLVTATGREAENAAAAVGDLIGDDNVVLFPSWETLPHERLSPRADTVGRRLATLRRIAHPELDAAGYPAVVVATVRSLIQPMAPHLGEMTPVTLRVGVEVDLSDLVQQLVALAYTRVDMVEKRGEIAVRGGILDLFPPTADHPVRVEFFGDEITDIRTFGVTDQRSLSGVDEVTAPPCREILLTADVRARAATLSAQQTGDPTGAYDDKLVAAAIRRELLREGQVFYVHNRVADIESVARRLREAVPEARIAVAHGQMNEDRLEKIIDGFWAREWDVLLCTTIVETGLDISNANTLIVDHAEVLGLSQMHQLRGRVGRGRERGYAYFLYPVEKPLTETAHDRLATIAQNSDLGAGMAVAMKDLEIRGAGSILGAEQSGHIAGVGFDLYIRLVGEAVTAFKKAASAVDGSEHDLEEAAEVRVELPIDANILHEYIPAERLRLDAYRRIAGATSPADVDAVRDELVDRYGPLGEQVENLWPSRHFVSSAARWG